MYKMLLAATTAAVFALPAAAQDATAPVPVQAVRVAEAPAHVLPAGTEIPLKMSETVTTKGKGWDEGDQFTLTVAAPVMLGDYVVIPQGTRGVGRITWLTSRGAFGKSGKMDVGLEYLEMGGRRINIDGTYRQEGDGATLATVGGVILAGVFAGFITGKSGVIPKDRELMATLEADLPVALPAGATVGPKPVTASYVPGSPEAAAAAAAAADAAAAASAAEVEAQRPPAELKIKTQD